jgi:hypothetical protein
MKNVDTQIRDAVLELIGITVEQYNELIYQCAEQYLSGFMPSYPQVVTQIMKSPQFWSWWIHHWQQRDKEFIELNSETVESMGTRFMLYQETHDCQTLLAAIYLNGQVLEETYARMIGEVTKSQLKGEPV